MRRNVATAILAVLGLAATAWAELPGSTVVTMTPELREGCLKVLRQALKSNEFWPSMHAAEGLTHAGHAEEVLATLKDRLGSEKDARKRCGLARELIRAGDRTPLPVLFEILEKADLDGRVHAAESLYKVGEAGDGKLLRQALASIEPGLHVMAAAALARGGDRKALVLLRNRLAGEDAEGRMQVAYVVARLGDASDIPQLLRNAREEKDALRRSFALNAAACLGDRSAAEAMLANLRSADPAIRAYAAEAAGVSRTSSSADRLTELLDDKAVDVRVRAAQALLALSKNPDK
jgi:sialidase-1